MQGEGCRVQGAGCRVQGAGSRMQGAGCRVREGLGSSLLALSLVQQHQPPLLLEMGRGSMAPKVDRNMGQWLQESTVIRVNSSKCQP